MIITKKICPNSSLDSLKANQTTWSINSRVPSHWVIQTADFSFLFYGLVLEEFQYQQEKKTASFEQTCVLLYYSWLFSLSENFQLYLSFQCLFSPYRIKDWVDYEIKHLSIYQSLRFLNIFIFSSFYYKFLLLTSNYQGLISKIQY